MLIATQLSSAIGPLDTRPAFKTQVQRIKAPAPITGGRNFQAGPFVLPVSADLDKLVLHITKRGTTESRLQHAIASWAVDAIWQVSQNHGYAKGWYSEWKAGPGSATSPFAKDGKSLWAKETFDLSPLVKVKNKTGKDQMLYPKYNQSDGKSQVDVGGYWVSAPGAPGAVRGVGFVMVPDDQVWPVGCFTGKDPIGRFTHPETHRTWGVHCLITGSEFQFSFKKIEKSLWGKILGFLPNLVSKILGYENDALNTFKDLACPLARQHLDTAIQIAAGDLALTPEIANRLLAAGLSPDDLDKLEKGATTAATEAIADKITTFICGKPKTPPSSKDAPKLPPATPTYAAGSVAAINPETGQWHVIAPLTGLAGEPTYEEVDIVAEKPAVPQISWVELLLRLGRTPWYRNWRVWLAIGVGVAGLTTGGVLLYRRRKKSRSEG